ncbi:hypothetical protein [Candidatus Amarobacter glycogenicus]|uniref:hypothetical protein n=1 Tax=Candidatus Amarobacter glycogenicus TaxID=3140699 RepID=UPI0031CCB2BA
MAATMPSRSQISIPSAAGDGKGHLEFLVTAEILQHIGGRVHLAGRAVNADAQARKSLGAQAIRQRFMPLWPPAPPS